jgi:hypothetical protein
MAPRTAQHPEGFQFVAGRCKKFPPKQMAATTTKKAGAQIGTIGVMVLTSRPHTIRVTTAFDDAQIGENTVSLA